MKHNKRRNFPCTFQIADKDKMPAKQQDKQSCLGIEMRAYLIHFFFRKTEGEVPVFAVNCLMKWLVLA